MPTKPRTLLRTEGALLLILTAAFYRAGHYPWWLFATLFFAPDLFMLGYVLNVKTGAVFYNLAHTLTLPLLLLLFSLIAPQPQLAPYALIWLAHVGFDRALGYGLSTPPLSKTPISSTSEFRKLFGNPTEPSLTIPETQPKISLASTGTLVCAQSQPTASANYSHRTRQ